MIRRCTAIDEIEGYNREVDGIMSRTAYTWKADEDVHIFKANRNSYTLEEKIAKNAGYADTAQIYDEHEKRKHILDRMVEGMGRLRDLDMLMELEKTQGIMPGTTICGLADGTAWATRTFINKFYDEFAARCNDETVVVPLTINQDARENVAWPMGSNTRM
jgi:hypothetical protein